VLGALGKAAAEVTPPRIERPPIRKIFRDGRYAFTTPGARFQRQVERTTLSAPGAAETFDKVVTRTTPGRERGNGPWYVIALVLSEQATRDVDTWDGVHDFVDSDPRIDLRLRRIRGHEVAWGVTRWEQFLLVNYSRDLMLRIGGTPTIRRAYIYDFARYLLRSR
jgi:hypothetical protein